MKDKIVGILGGMGPEATVDLFSAIVRETHAKSDADHLRIIVDNNPDMPSRQNAILKNTESPAPAMIKTAQNLKNAGADFIIIGANTAHYFYEEVSAAVDVPFLHIIDEAIKELLRIKPDIKNVGVLATSAAVKAKLYNKSCEKFGINVVAASDEYQDLMHSAVFDYKYNGLNEKNVADTLKVTQHLVDNGAEAVIMGCTEIPLILKNQKLNVLSVDPNEIIAKVAVAYAKHKYTL